MKKLLSGFARPSARVVSTIKGLLFVLALLPFVRLIVAGVRDSMGEAPIALLSFGVNPVEFITRDTGDWVLIFLCITLAVTPLRRITGWNWLLRMRRMFGLYSFFYVVLHFITYIWFDQEFSLAGIVKDIIKRPFITVGFAAFLLLVPLAATSTNNMVRRLGAKSWLALHRAVYVIAGLAILHFWWMKAGKHDFTKPIIYGTILAILLLSRVVYFVRERQAKLGQVAQA